MLIDEPRMTGAELQTVREYLGLTGDRLASLLAVSPRTLRSWESAREAIPDSRTEGRTPVATVLAQLEADTVSAVSELVKVLRNDPKPMVDIYRTDEDFAERHPETAHLGARWWRHVVARASYLVPGLRVFDYGKVGLYDGRGEGATHVATVGATLGQPVEYDGVTYWPASARAIGDQPFRWRYVRADRF